MTKTMMTLESLQAKWIGRKIHGSTSVRTDELDGKPADRTIERIWLSDEGQYFAWAVDAAGHGEHHKGNSPAKLDARLSQLS